MKVKEESEKAGLKLNIQKKPKIMASMIYLPSLHGKRWWNNGKNDRISRVPYSLQMVIAPMKLKDTFSFEEKL